jgi:hypothetical protein
MICYSDEQTEDFTDPTASTSAIDDLSTTSQHVTSSHSVELLQRSAFKKCFLLLEERPKNIIPIIDLLSRGRKMIARIPKNSSNTLKASTPKWLSSTLLLAAFHFEKESNCCHTSNLVLKICLEIIRSSNDELTKSNALKIVHLITNGPNHVHLFTKLGGMKILLQFASSHVNHLVTRNILLNVFSYSNQETNVVGNIFNQKEENGFKCAREIIAYASKGKLLKNPKIFQC